MRERLLTIRKRNASLQSMEPLANAGDAPVVVDACRRLSPEAAKRQRLGL